MNYRKLVRLSFNFSLLLKCYKPKDQGPAQTKNSDSPQTSNLVLLLHTGSDFSRSKL